MSSSDGIQTGKIEQMYQNAKKHTLAIIAGCLLIGFSTSLVDLTLNLRKELLIDPQNGERYDYILESKVGSRHLYVWFDGNDTPFRYAPFPTIIRDSDADGKIDFVGTVLSPRIPFELNRLNARSDYREKAQRLYDLALADSKHTP